MRLGERIAWWVEVVFRVGLGGLFVYAAWYKIQDPAMFADAVASYRLLPLPVVGVVALVLPMAELVAGFALVATKWSREAALMILMMLVVFLIGLVQAWVRGLEIVCACFGPEDAGGSPLWLDILRDIALCVPTIWLLTRPGRWIWRT